MSNDTNQELGLQQPCPMTENSSVLATDSEAILMKESSQSGFHQNCRPVADTQSTLSQITAVDFLEVGR